MPIQRIVLEGKIAPELEKTYFYLPFDVPAGTTLIEVAFSYTDRIGSNPMLTGGNTIDLGIFDAGGIDFLKAGFRGWSGSERDQILISENEATPGYLAGPIPPGRWNILLGLYKLAPQGCQYRAEVAVTTQAGGKPTLTPSPGTDELPKAQPAVRGDQWLSGELHCHTWNSDGQLSVAQVVQRAYERGLNFLAIADHNTTAAQRELAVTPNPGMVFIRGVEVTTFKGHFNVWGIPDWIDFRVNTPEEMEATLKFAREKGGLTSCSHPKPFGPNWDYPTVTDYACIEVWNGPWNGLNEISLEYWLGLLAEGRRISAVGGSDYHRPGEMSGWMERDLGTPTNRVFVRGTADMWGILDGVRQGHVSLSDVPEGPFLNLQAGRGFTTLAGDALEPQPAQELPFQIVCQRGAGGLLRLLDQRGVIYEQEVTQETEQIEVALPVGERLYVRAELRTPEGMMRALTNPVYLKGQKP